MTPYVEAYAIAGEQLKALVSECDALHIANADLRARLSRVDQRLQTLEAILKDGIQFEQPFTAVQQAKPLLDSHQYREAAEILQQHLRDFQHDPLAWNNYGMALYNLGAIDDAIGAFRSSIAIDPRYPDAHRNLGMTLLAQGRYAEGWREHAWRTKCIDQIVQGRPHKQPVGWSDKMLVVCEQGIGDQILHASMFSGLPHGTVVECEQRLAGLFQRSFPWLTIVPPSLPVDPRAVACETQIMAGDLGATLRSSVESFPQGRPFLYPALAASTRRRVGLSTKSTNTKYGAAKSFDPSPLGKFGAVFVGLDDRDRNDLDALATTIASCELVITASNTNAHLAAALGVPTWVLVPANIGRYWYWGVTGDRTPWYPNVRLFRQAVDGQWAEPVRMIATKLQRVLEHGEDPLA